MKKTAYLLTVMLLLVAVPVFANCGMCGMEKGDAASIDDIVASKVEKMSVILGLTEGQASQVGALIKEKLEKKKAIKAEKMEKIEAVSEEYSAKIKALLTEEQQAKYDVMKAEWGKEGMKEGAHGHMMQHPGAMDAGGEDTGTQTP